MSSTSSSSISDSVAESTISNPDIKSRAWEDDIKDVDVKSDWKLFIIFVIETDATFSCITELLNKTIANCPPKAIRIISDDLIQKLALDHCYKTDERTPFSALCESVKQAGGCHFREKIPLELLTYMIKYVILFEREKFLQEKLNASKLKFRARKRYVHMALLYDLGKEVEEPTVKKVEEESKKGVKKAGMKNEGAKGKGLKNNVSPKKSPTKSSSGVSTCEDEIMEYIKELKKESESECERMHRKERERMFKRCASRKMKFKFREWRKQMRLIMLQGERSETNFEDEKMEQEAEIQEDDRELEKDDTSDSEASSEESGGDNVPAADGGGSVQEEEEEEKSVRGKGAKEVVGKVKKDKVKGGKPAKDETEPEFDPEEAYIEDKIDTSLHKRSEPLRHKVSPLDDSPIKGPDIYFLITSMKEPDLPEALQNLNVPTNGFIFIGNNIIIPESTNVNNKPSPEPKYDEYVDYMNKYGNYLSFLSAATIESSCIKSNMNSLEVLDEMERELANFYVEFCDKLHTCDLYKNIIMAKYLPDLKEIDFNADDYLESLLEILFSDVSKIAYHFYKVTKLYKHYMKLPSTDLTDITQFTLDDMTLYNEILSNLPNETQEVPMLLDTLISQVCVNNYTDYGYNPEDYVEEVTQIQEETNDLESTLKKLRKKYFFHTEKKPEDVETVVIQFGDQIGLETVHYGRWSELAKDRTVHILELFFKRLVEHIKPNLSEEEIQLNKYHFQSLQQACENLALVDSKTLIDMLIAILMLELSNPEKIQQESIRYDGKTSLRGSESNISAIETNYPSLMKALDALEAKILKDRSVGKILEEETRRRATILQMINEHELIGEIIRTLNNVEIKQLLSKITHFEKMPKEVFLQVLWKAFQENDIESKYIPLIKKSIFLCYKQNITSTVEKGVLPTYMNLRDFFKYGIEDLKDWCEEEEKFITADQLRDVFISETYKLKDEIIDPIPPIKITEELELTSNLFEYPPKQQKLFENEKDTSSSKNDSDQKSITKSLFSKNTEFNVNNFINPYQAPLIFDFGSLRLKSLRTNIREFLFTDSTLFTFKVFTDFYEPRRVSLIVKQEGNNIIFHSPLVINHEQKRVTFTHSNGIQISFFEVEQETSDELMNEKDSEHSVTASTSSDEQEEEEGEVIELNLKVKNQNADEVNDPSSNEKPKDKPKRLPKVNDPGALQAAAFECQFSVPNGLYVISKKLEDGCIYVKQQFINGVPDKVRNEMFRLNLHDGTAIKILEDSTTEILYACGRQVILPKFIDHLRMKEMTEDNDELDDIYRYLIYEPDGNQYITEDYERFLIAEKKLFEKNEIFRNSRLVTMEDDGPWFDFNGGGVQTVTFMDGTRITTDVHIGEEVFCDWTVEELKMWFEGNWEEKSSTGTEEETQIEEVTAETDSEEMEMRKARKLITSLSSSEDSEKDLGYMLYGVKQCSTPASSIIEELEEEALYSDKDSSTDLINEQSWSYQRSSRSLNKLNLEEDGFVWITTSHVIQHPSYVSTATYPFNCNKVAFLLPEEMLLIRHGNGCFDLSIKNETVLSLRKDQIILDKLQNNNLFQRSIINYKIFDYHLLPNDNNILFECVDKLKNWLTFDIRGDIKYNLVNVLYEGKTKADSQDMIKDLTNIYYKSIRHQESVPIYLLESSRRFVLDYNLTGAELFLTGNLEKFKMAMEQIRCSHMKFFQETPFLAQLYLLPCNNDYEIWKMPYAKMETVLPYKFPSTYGDDWLFPFRICEPIKCDHSELVIARFTNEFLYADMHKILKDVIEEYYKVIVQDSLYKKRIQDGKRIFTQREMPKSRVGMEAFILRLYLYREGVVIADYDQVQLFKVEPPRKKEPYKKILKTKIDVSKDFRRIAHDVYTKNFDPYFESPNGIAFSIIDCALTRAMGIAQILDLQKRIQQILDKPMKMLTEQDLKDLALFFKIFHKKLWGPKKINIKKVIKAAMKLSEFFPNMRHALELNVDYHGVYTAEGICNNNENQEEEKD